MVRRASAVAVAAFVYVACVVAAQPCTPPVADVLFVLDASSSVEDPAAGGTEDAFGKSTAFAAKVAQSFGDAVKQDSVRIASVSFATKAKKLFDLTATSTAAVAARKLERAKYTGEGGPTEANLHTALKLARKKILPGRERSVRRPHAWVAHTHTHAHHSHADADAPRAASHRTAHACMHVPGFACVHLRGAPHASAHEQAARHLV